MTGCASYLEPLRPSPPPQLVSRKDADTLLPSQAPPKLPVALWPLPDLEVQS